MAGMGHQASQPARHFRVERTPWPLATAIEAWLPICAAEGEESIKALFAEARNLAHYGLSVPELRPVKTTIERVSLDGIADPQGAAKDGDEQQMAAVLLRVWGYLLERVLDRIRPVVPLERQGKQGGDAARLAALVDELVNGGWWDVQWGELAAEDLSALAEAMYQRSGTYWTNWLETEGRRGGVAFDPNLTNLDAAAYARDWTDTVLMDFGTTTRRGMGAVLSTWASTPGANMGMLEQALRDSFTLSQQRAMVIATTETTRIYAQGQQASFDQFGQQMGGRAEVVPIWQTMNDGKVCEICRDRQGKARGDGWDEIPPAHVGCYCFISGEVRVVAVEDATLPESENAVAAAERANQQSLAQARQITPDLLKAGQ